MSRANNARGHIVISCKNRRWRVFALEQFFGAGLARAKRVVPVGYKLRRKVDSTFAQAVLIAEKTIGHSLVLRIACDERNPRMAQTCQIARHFSAHLTIVCRHRKFFATRFAGRQLYARCIC